MGAEMCSGPPARELAANRDNLSVLGSQGLVRAARRTLARTGLRSVVRVPTTAQPPSSEHRLAHSP